MNELLSWVSEIWFVIITDKTQCTTIILETCCPVTNTKMNGTNKASTDSLLVLEVSVSSAKTARKVGYLFRDRKNFSAEQLLTLYDAQGKFQIENCSRISSAAKLQLN